jgi:hypothetical protein
MNTKNRKTLDLIFVDPIRADVSWKDIEALFVELGGRISEGSGSRIRVQLGGVRAVFHRPHPKPAADKGLLQSVRRFLENAGERP